MAFSPPVFVASTVVLSLEYKANQIQIICIFLCLEALAFGSQRLFVPSSVPVLKFYINCRSAVRNTVQIGYQIPILGPLSLSSKYLFIACNYNYSLIIFARERQRTLFDRIFRAFYLILIISVLGDLPRCDGNIIIDQN